MKSVKQTKRYAKLLLWLSGTLLLSGSAWSQSLFTHAHHRIPEGAQAEAAQWYQRVFSGEMGEIGPGPLVRYQNGFVGTMAHDGLAGDGSASVIDHIGIAVTDVRATAALIENLGGVVREGPRTATPNGGPIIAHITDPWGGRFEILETGNAPRIDHVHLNASDADAMRDWFLDVFGGEVEEIALPFHRIVYDNVIVHINQAAPGNEPAASRYRTTDHIGFIVPSLAEFREDLVASGYTPYLERPNPPGADLMFFEGPDGLHVEMTETR